MGHTNARLRTLSHYFPFWSPLLVHVLFQLCQVCVVIYIDDWALRIEVDIIFTWTKGIRHPDVKCRGCYQSPIVGIRWHCLDCSTMCNLCTICYMADEHEKNHMFERIYKQDQKGYVWCDLHFAHLWLCSFLFVYSHVYAFFTLTNAKQMVRSLIQS